MSNWKRLAQKNINHNNSYSSIKQQKYTPKRLQNYQINSTRFHNTIQKMNHSGISEDKDKFKDKSFIQKNGQIQSFKPLKGNLSQVRLPRELINEGRNSVIMTSGSVIMNIPDYPQTKIKSSITYNNQKKIDKNILYQQLQKIKKQFNTFQIIIFNQLKKKQKQISLILQNILHHIKSMQLQSSYHHRDYREHQTYNQYESSPQLINSSHQKLSDMQSKSITQVDNLGSKLSQQINHILQVVNKPQKQLKLNVSVQSLQDKGKKRTFNKFFQAVENLKRDIKDLNQISDVSSIKTPKSELDKCTKQNWQNFNKIRH